MTVKKMTLERSKIFAMGIIYILVMTVIPFTNIGISTGDSTIHENEPVEISTVEELQAMRDDLGADYVLVNDIDASATREWNNGKGFEPVGNWSNRFEGNFYGQNHTINGLYINRPSTYRIGLFGILDTGVEVKNIGLIDNNITGYIHVGGVVGQNWGGTVSNSYATGNVSGSDYVGGLVGDNSGTVSNSYVSVDVSGNNRVGGLVGDNSYGGTVSNSYASGVVSGNNRVGGLVGDNSYGGTVSNSFYNIDSVLINDGHHITKGGIFNEQYEDWFNNGLYLTISDYSDTLVPVGDNYEISGTDGLRDLLGFAGREEYRFKLTADIDLSDEPGLYVPYLAADFDGKNHTVSNLHIDIPFGANVGLFGHVNSDSEIRYLGVVDADVSGNSNIGGLVGLNSGKVLNSYVSVDVSGRSWIGGLVGRNYCGMVNNSYATGTVSGLDNVGGLVGSNDESLIENSYAIGDVSGNGRVGGLVGLNGRVVSNSYATGNVSGIDNVGGLVGVNYEGGTVFNSYATGEVRGEEKVGGLIGYQEMFIATRGSIDIEFKHLSEDLDTSNTDVDLEHFDWVYKTGEKDTFFSIFNSYATGNVFGQNDVGGLVGQSKHYSIIDSYATGDVIGKNNVGGLIGVCISFSITNYYFISNSYARGDVTGEENVGGLIGHNRCTIKNSYSTGMVEGDENVGGLIGINRERKNRTFSIQFTLGSVHHSFHDKETSGQEDAIGFDNGTAENVHSLTTAQMKNDEAFIDAGWDFEDTWSIDDDRNDGYPYLQWQEFDEEGSSNYLSNEVILGIIIVIAIVAVAFFVLRKKRSGGSEKEKDML